MTDRDNYPMRAPCRCGHAVGRLVEKNGQDTVRCLNCDSYCYCAPRAETGREVRNVRTREGIRPSKRTEILIRDGHRCVLCHADGEILHVGHIISVDAGTKSGMTDDEVNDDENLAAMCEACNLGIGPQPLPLRTAIAIVRARISWRNTRGLA
jgi:5-methylcytosine-specific restriction endonuclease McrA